MCLDCSKKHKKEIRKKRRGRQTTNATCTLWEIYAPDEHLTTYAWRWTIKFGVVEVVHKTSFNYYQEARTSAIRWAERNMPFLKLNFKDRSKSNFDHLI